MARVSKKQIDINEKLEKLKAEKLDLMLKYVVTQHEIEPAQRKKATDRVKAIRLLIADLERGEQVFEEEDDKPAPPSLKEIEKMKFKSNVKPPKAQGPKIILKRGPII